MAAVAEEIKNLDYGQQPEPPLFATARPTLWPHMLWPRAKQAMPFPFNQPHTRYYYHARNGIYEFGQLLGLSGQEVLFPAYFQGVELEAIMAAGVRLRFYPVHRKMRVDPAEVAAMIGPQTRAIYLTHYVGFPGPVKELQAICREHGLLLIEDCGHAMLSCLGDEPLGSMGDASIYCIYKSLAAPHGGAILLRDQAVNSPQRETPSLVSLASYIATSVLLNLETRGSAMGHALRRTAMGWGKAALNAAKVKRDSVSTLYFDVSRVNLAMSDFVHTILNAQDYRQIITRRRENYLYLLDRLRAFSAPPFEGLPTGVCPIYYPFLCRDSQDAHRRLRARGVETITVWREPHPVMPEGTFPEVDALRRSVLWVPCHQDLTPAAISRVADAVQAVAKEMQ